MDTYNLDCFSEKNLAADLCVCSHLQLEKDSLMMITREGIDLRVLQNIVLNHLKSKVLLLLLYVSGPSSHWLLVNQAKWCMGSFS